MSELRLYKLTGTGGVAGSQLTVYALCRGESEGRKLAAEAGMFAVNSARTISDDELPEGAAVVGPYVDPREHRASAAEGLPGRFERAPITTLAFGICLGLLLFTACLLVLLSVLSYFGSGGVSIHLGR